uniref:Sec-independent protein translocase component TatC n=1 Tax=Polysiphonia sertularioides TaxID=945028 RepID=A0A1Z1MG83_9FLOR|nr:Sec-independent protein translocase component TatC [Polysiphonia sertularioides]
MRNREKYMPILEHVQELKERVLIIVLVFFISSSVCIIYANEISLILQKPALGIKFLQLGPGEYLGVSIKISLYLSLFINSPFILYQILRFTLPGLTREESKYVIPTAIGSLCLFCIGGIFSYTTLVPITLKFLSDYGSDIVEPVWSFSEYFNFISMTIITTGFCFQIPIIQIILGVTNIVQWKVMLKNWKYIIFGTTIISALITPSTDPITQVFTTSTLLLLYFSGVLILKIVKN